MSDTSRPSVSQRPTGDNDIAPPERLSEQYKLRFRLHEAYRNAMWKCLISDFFQRFFSPSDTILDLGCGWGEFINNVVADQRFAMDLNPDSENHLKEGTRFFHQDCSQTWDLPDSSLDVVFTSNFLEHLEDKSAIEKTFIQAHRCLKPDGRLICLGPNLRFLPGTYWDFWDHHVGLTDRSLCECLELHGFSPKLSIPKFLPYTMSGNRQPPIFFVRMYLRLPFVWRWMGKQFLIIAHRNHPPDSRS